MGFHERITLHTVNCRRTVIISMGIKLVYNRACMFRLRRLLLLGACASLMCQFCNILFFIFVIMKTRRKKTDYQTRQVVIIEYRTKRRICETFFLCSYHRKEDGQLQPVNTSSLPGTQLFFDERFQLPTTRRSLLVCYVILHYTCLQVDQTTHKFLLREIRAQFLL